MTSRIHKVKNQPEVRTIQFTWEQQKYSLIKNVLKLYIAHIQNVTIILFYFECLIPYKKCINILYTKIEKHCHILSIMMIIQTFGMTCLLWLALEQQVIVSAWSDRQVLFICFLLALSGWGAKPKYTVWSNAASRFIQGTCYVNWENLNLHQCIMSGLHHFWSPGQLKKKLITGSLRTIINAEVGEMRLVLGKCSTKWEQLIWLNWALTSLGSVFLEHIPSTQSYLLALWSACATASTPSIVLSAW